MPELIIIKSAAAARTILEDQTNWKVTWGEAITFLASQGKHRYGVDYCLAGDNPPNAASRALVKKGLYPSKWQGEVKSFYESNTNRLLQQYQYRIPNTSTYEVDIVRDVANLVNALFAASVFSLPIKTPESPHGLYTEQEMYQVLSLLFIAIFFDGDIAKSFQLRQAAHALAQQLGELVLMNAEVVAKTGFIADFVASLGRKSELSDYGIHMIRRLLDGKLSVKDVVWSHL